MTRYTKELIFLERYGRAITKLAKDLALNTYELFRMWIFCEIPCGT
jgi:hypothetical protein